MRGFLDPEQRKAVERMKNGCILNGDVGSGKSRTSLYYFFRKFGGQIPTNGNIKRMKKPKDLYIITTAKKRDSREWELEMAPFRMSTDPKLSAYKHTVIVDSWNNIKKYTDVSNSFFIFDEDRVTGSGAWVKAFYKITRSNEWIILSATPGDKWEDYIPVFIANGFYKNKSEFIAKHLRYSPYCKWQVNEYVGTKELTQNREDILVDMDVHRDTIRHNVDVLCNYEKHIYLASLKNRWDPFKQEPIQQASGLCYVLRKIVNSDESRIASLLEILETVPKAIIFYNFDYELEILKRLFVDDDCTSQNIFAGYEVAEWNGHLHQPVPTSAKWVYLVQYTSGCEGWNCITTDTIIFYSQTYSYKTLAQACGRIDRLNTPYKDLYYYHLKSSSSIDLAIGRALKNKKKFNEKSWFTKHGGN